MRRSLTIVLALFIPCCAFGQVVASPTIQTFAGGGVPWNVPGTSANLQSPSSVAVDGAGNLFLAELDHLVLRLDATTGLLTVVAGNGAAGFSGDGGPAAGAQLAYPQGVAVDAAGNLYIADSGNNRIRKVSSTVITTVAGNGTAGFSGDSGPATSAELNAPMGVAVDAAGNLYIADSGNNRIRKVSNGVIATVAGTGTAGYSGDTGPATGAGLNEPSAVAVDVSGSLYIADTGNNRIRKVSNGVIATVAGNGSTGFSGDNGPASLAALDEPWGIALDASGNLYIDDTDNNRIRKVSNGVIATVAGNGTAGFSGDSGPATSAELNLFVNGCPIFQSLPAPNEALSAVQGFGCLSSAGGAAAVDGAGNLYIADSGNNRIRKVSSGAITTVAGNGDDEDNGPAISALLANPQGVAVDAAGNVYIADTGNNRIRKVSNGIMTTVAGYGPQGYNGDNGPATGAH
ncbi:MAG: NHL repeat-containing protein [Bryobacteraceae bacterium]|jgi:sugar lactone lactonase YvrE